MIEAVECTLVRSVASGMWLASAASPSTSCVAARPDSVAIARAGSAFVFVLSDGACAGR